MYDHPPVCMEQLLLHGFHDILYWGAFVKIGEENSVLKWADISGTLLENLSIFVIMQNSSRVEKSLR